MCLCLINLVNYDKVTYSEAIKIMTIKSRQKEKYLGILYLKIHKNLYKLSFQIFRNMHRKKEIQ